MHDGCFHQGLFAWYMFEFPAELIDKISNYSLSFIVVETRLSATFAFIFFFRREWVPLRIMMILSLLLSYFVLCNLSEPLFDPAIGIMPKLSELASQFFLGIITGIIVNFFIEFFIGFGQIVSMQAGLGFVNFFIPKVGSVTPLTQFFMLLATLIFLQLNAHLVVIKMVLNMFLYVPTLPALNESFFLKMVDYTTILFQGIVMMSLAVVFSILLVNMTLGLLTKFTPQLNIFSVGINVSLLVCFFILYIGFDFIVENGTILCNELMSFLKAWT